MSCESEMGRAVQQSKPTQSFPKTRHENHQFSLSFFTSLQTFFQQRNLSVCKGFFSAVFQNPVMGFYCFSLASLCNKRLIKRFASAGLVSRHITIDAETRIQCWVPRKLGAQKQNVVLIHGFGPDAEWQWYCQVGPLSTFFNIYVPDLAFFGDSLSSGSERSEIFQAECLMKLMERLEVKKFSAVGTSYGGFVAYHLAHLYPESVEKVVIASSAVYRQPKDNLELLRRANLGDVSELLLPQSPGNLRTLLRLSVHKYPYSIIPDFILKDFLQALYLKNRQEKVELLGGIIVGTEKAPPLPVIRQDVLIIWGIHDQIFPVDLAYQLKKYLGNQAKLVIIKDASHVPQVEKPEEFNNSVKNFILCDNM